MTRRQFIEWATRLGVLAGGAGYAWWSGRLRVDRSNAVLWHRPTPVRLGVLTDFHVPNYTFEPADLYAALDRAECDLLLIVGDTVDQPGNERRIEPLLGRLSAPLGVFATLGNHEHWHGIDIDKVGAAYADAGIRLLINESVDLDLGGATLRLDGLDDPTAGHPNFGLLTQPHDGPRVVMCHSPGAVPEFAKLLPPDAVILSGHTHGGQIAPFGWAPYTPGGSGDFVAGWYTVKGRRLYVSRGLGNVGFNVRLGSPPTVAVIDVR